MSETEVTSEWGWQGFEGTMASVTKAKALVDAMPLDVVGAVIPDRGEPPFPWLRDSNSRGIFAVHTRLSNPLPKPTGTNEADPNIVPRILGA